MERVQPLCACARVGRVCAFSCAAHTASASRRVREGRRFRQVRAAKRWLASMTLPETGRSRRSAVSFSQRAISSNGASRTKWLPPTIMPSQSSQAPIVPLHRLTNPHRTPRARNSRRTSSIAVRLSAVRLSIVVNFQLGTGPTVSSACRFHDFFTRRHRRRCRRPRATATWPDRVSLFSPVRKAWTHDGKA